MANCSKSTPCHVLIVIVVAMASLCVQARTLEPSESQVSAVIPSPNQDFYSGDIQRTSSSSSSAAQANYQSSPEQADASNESPSVPVYVSPFNRQQRAVSPISTQLASYETRQESSHAPANYATVQPQVAALPAPADLKTSASYGHGGHHHHYGGHHDSPSGWLDMGAWTGGKGSFGWYADYPVGGKHYGRK